MTSVLFEVVVSDGAMFLVRAPVGCELELRDQEFPIIQLDKFPDCVPHISPYAAVLGEFCVKLTEDPSDASFIFPYIKLRRVPVAVLGLNSVQPEGAEAAIVAVDVITETIIQPPTGTELISNAAGVVVDALRIVA